MGRPWKAAGHHFANLTYYYLKFQSKGLNIVEKVIDTGLGGLLGARFTIKNKLNPDRKI